MICSRHLSQRWGPRDLRGLINWSDQNDEKMPHTCMGYTHLMFLEIFSNLNDSIILWFPLKQEGTMPAKPEIPAEISGIMLWLIVSSLVWGLERNEAEEGRWVEEISHLPQRALRNRAAPILYGLEPLLASSFCTSWSSAAETVTQPFPSTHL